MTTYTVRDSLTGRNYDVEERYTGHCPQLTVPGIGTVCGTLGALGLATAGTVGLVFYFGTKDPTLKSDNFLIMGSVCTFASGLCCAAVTALYCRAIGCCSRNG